MFIDGCNEIPLPLKNVLTPEDDPWHNAVIEVLSRYSLVSKRRMDNNEVFITVHKLIQEAAMFGFEDNEDNKDWIDCCLNIANSVLDYQYDTREDFDAFSLYLPHILKIAEHAEKFSDDDATQAKRSRIIHEVGRGLSN